MKFRSLKITDASNVRRARICEVEETLYTALHKRCAHSNISKERSLQQLAHGKFVIEEYRELGARRAPTWTYTLAPAYDNAQEVVDACSVLGLLWRDHPTHRPYGSRLLPSELISRARHDE